MLLTDGEKQMASQRPVKQRDTCTDKSYSTLSLHITAWQKKTNGLTEAREAEGYMHGQTLQHVVPPHHWMAYAVGITV